MRTLLIILICVAVAGIIVPPFFFEAHRITPIEIRYYVILSIVGLLTFCFGILRLYNAIVINTKYIIKLDREIKNLQTAFSKFNRVVESKFEAPIKQLINALNKYGDIIRKS